MKKYFFLAAMAACIMSCSNGASEYLTGTEPTEPTTVTLTFSPYDMEAMTTRAAVVPVGSPAGAGTTRAAVADFANKLDIWLYEGSTLLQTVQQESSQTGFATLSLILDKRKTYTLHAVAHKSSSGHATLADGLISWSNDKITQSFYYTQTFTPAETTTLNCLMTRIVGQFRLETTDHLPSEATRATIDVPQTFTAWSTATNAAATPKDRTVNFSTVSPNQDGTVTLSCYLISTASSPTNHTLTVTFYDNSDQQVQQRIFEDVPIRNGYKTCYRGSFFIDTPMSISFTTDDWQEYDAVEF